MTKLLPVVLIICLALMPLAAATGTETRITFNASKQVAPSIWEEWIAWEDYRNDDGSGLSDIYLFNVGSGEESRLTPYGSKAYSPSVNNGEIVWWEGDAINSTWNIMYNTLPPSQSAIIYSSPTNETKAPAVFSGKVVWQDADTTGTWLSDIMMFDASTGETVDLTPGTQDSDQQNPAVYGNTVVWEDLRNGPVPELFMTDTSSGITTPVSIASGIQRAPAIFGNNITWMDTRAGDFDILLYDLDSKILTNVTPFHNGLATDNQENPALQGNRLAWLDNRNRGYSSLFDIMMKNIASPAGETIQVTGSNAKITADYDPALHENRIIWVDERGNNPDIYLYTDGVAAACPVASFTKDVAVGGAPLTVQFTDTSQPSQATYWFWDFGDGTGSTQKNPQHTFNDPGVYMVSLTVGNPFCRNMTPVVCSSYVFADSPPIVDFTASPLAGLPPFSVSFTDKSCGQSTSWAWDFNNDGLIDSTAKNPVNKSTFITPGTEYSVSLTAGNGYGSGPNTTTKNKLIRVFLGNTATAQLPVSGIVTEYRDGFQYLDYNLSTVPDATPSAPMNAPDFITLPPSGYNWEKIMFLSADPDGFTLKSNGNVTGKIARTGFRTRHVNGPASPSIGTGWGIGYQLDSLVYPGSATLTTEVWDGATKTDTADFQIASSKANFLYMSDIPFTARIFNNGFKVHGNATVNLSIQTSWIAAHSDAGTALHIIALGYTPSGDHVAMVLPIKSHISSGGVDYLEADTPGLCSKFALAQHSGGGNVFQMVYLGVTEHYVSPPSGDSDTGPPSSAGGESGQGATSKQEQPQLNPPQQAPIGPTATSVDLFINELGIVTQTTVLESIDKLAAVAIGQGITALDASGKALSSVSIDPLGPGRISAMSSPDSMTFAGLAYDLQPAGATFSPAITITFTVPNARWGQQYVVRELDDATGRWTDLPTIYNPESGTISASVSHFCTIALFSSAVTQKPVAAAATMVEKPAPAAVPTPAPVTALGIFYNIVAFMTDLMLKNLVFILLIVIIIAAIYLRGRKGRLDRIRYNR